MATNHPAGDPATDAQAKVNGIVQNDQAKQRVPVHTFNPDSSPQQKAAAAGKAKTKLDDGSVREKAAGAKGVYFISSFPLCLSTRAGVCLLPKRTSHCCLVAAHFNTVYAASFSVPLTFSNSPKFCSHISTAYSCLRSRLRHNRTCATSNPAYDHHHGRRQ